jgi:UDP-N-acetyl-D-glucosamine dehydrogenase
VVFHDPYIPTIREDGHERHGVALTREELSAADVVMIVTDHRAIDYQLVADHAALVVDSRNAMAGTVASRARVVSLSTVATSHSAALT